MKVSGNNLGNSLQNVDAAKSQKTEAEKKADTATQAMNSEDVKNSAKVNLSGRAQAMQKAKEIASEETVDEAKVARLQKLIDEGKYSVDASAIADRLVDQHLMFPE